MYSYGDTLLAIVKVANTHEGMVRHLQAVTGCGIIRLYEEKREKNRDVWNWRVTKQDDLRGLLAVVSPLMLAKKPQAELLRAFLDIQRDNRYTAEQHVERERIRLELRELNQVGRWAK